jgi:hypothetical protein
MGSLSDYAEKKILEHLVGKTAFAKLTAFVALFTVAPSDAGGGTECPGANYERVETAEADWNPADEGQIQNAAQIDFPTPDAADWGTLKAFALFDAAEDGNMLGWSLLTAEKSPGEDDPVYFPVGSLVITLD